MFPRNNRLPLRTLRDFFEKAQKIRIGGLLVFFQKTTASTRVTVIIPKRVAQKSTARIAQKRALYTELQKVWPEFTGLNVAIVLVVEKPLSREQVAGAVVKLLAKLHELY